MMSGIDTGAEFSVCADLRRLLGDSKTFNLAAGPEERARIADRLGVRAVNALEGTVTLKVARTHLKATGSLRAELRRECVASLEEMTEHIDEPFEIEFQRGASSASRNATDLQEGEDPDAPEVHEGDELDLGEILTQQLSLAMAPFPRKAEAVSLADEYGEDKVISPFAALVKER